jgi:hypothetical protein
MQLTKQWQRMIVLVVLYVIFLTTMILSDLWKWHDSKNFLLHVSLLTNFFLVIGLLFWFGERWKYFRMTVLIVFLICCAYTTIRCWQKGDAWGYIFYPIWTLWGLFSLKEEIVRHKILDNAKETNDELLSGSEK